MTDAQWNVRLKQIAYESQWADREFRKECVTQGIVMFSRENGSKWYTVRYRDRYVCMLFNEIEDKRILMAVWSAIRTAEQLLEEVKGVKHDC